MPIMTPPNAITTLGPYLSTNHASTGTSQVSVTTKSVKASWIAARPQWYFASIGSTNSVQPYCRFAIIAMQTTPIASCIQRKYGASAGAVGCVVVAVMIPPEGTLLLNDERYRFRAFWYVICQSASHSFGGGRTCIRCRS